MFSYSLRAVSIRLWKWYSTTKDYSEFLAYQTTQKLVTKTIRAAKRSLERKLAKNAKKNPRAFYSHLNKQTKHRSAVGPLQDSSGAVKSND